jgi:RNA-directed DNA polymerase
MAKTYKNLFEKFTTFEALHAAWLRVIKGRRHQLDVIRFENDLETNLIDIQNSLIWKTYQTGPYRNFKVFEPKERDIAALPLKDRIVQHAMIEALDPIWAVRFIFDTYACRPGKGTHAGADRAQAFLRASQREHGAVYVLKADISKYFPLDLP